jgi:hypothetical protein
MIDHTTSSIRYRSLTTCNSHGAATDHELNIEEQRKRLLFRIVAGAAVPWDTSSHLARIRENTDTHAQEIRGNWRIIYFEGLAAVELQR